MHPCTVHEPTNFIFYQFFSLKMGPTVLFTHLKIILLQCFQFSVFSFSKISSIQTDPIYYKSKIMIVGTRFSLTRSWTIRPRPKKSHTMKFVEYGLKNLVPVGSKGSLHVLSGCRNVNQENVSGNGSSIHGFAFIQ